MDDDQDNCRLDPDRDNLAIQTIRDFRLVRLGITKQQLSNIDKTQEALPEELAKSAGHPMIMKRLLEKELTNKLRELEHRISRQPYDVFRDELDLLESISATRTC